MGSAVSSVSGALGGVLGSGIQGITSNVIPGANLANQDKLNGITQQLQNNGNVNSDYAHQQFNQSIDQLADTQNTIGSTQNAIQNAQNVNQGGNVANSLALLQGAAQGTAPSAAQAQLQSGKDQAIATQQAMANSGNLSQMISGQKTAMDNAANLTQQAANQSAQLRAQEMATARQSYATGAGQQAVQAGTNAGLQNNLANTQVGLYNTQANNALGFSGASNAANVGAVSGATGGLGIQQTAQNQAQDQQAQAAGGMLNGIGSAAMMMSDEDSKTDVQSDRPARAKGLSDFFRNENKPSDDAPKQEQDQPTKASGYGDDDPRKQRAQQIKAGFMSDEDTKKDIKQGSMLHAFLDKIEPVTYEYKEPTGEMGKTPGTHMGIIAQDVEKAPGGDSMVIDTPEGKAIDMASAMGMLMAAAADSHERMSSLEELFKSKKKGK